MWAASPGRYPIDEYRDRLIEAGFAQVDIIDTGSDLNAYAKVENQSGCCSPAMGSTLPMVSTGSCCSPLPPAMPIFTGDWPTCCADTT